MNPVLAPLITDRPFARAGTPPERISLSLLRIKSGAADTRAMARSPLLRVLQQLAADHAAADRLGVPVETAIEQRLTRRQLVRRGGAAGAALLAAPALVGFGRT